MTRLNSKTFLFFTLCNFNIFIGLCTTIPSFDVLVIGGGASGIAAGVQSARMGAKTLIIEETTWLGGMLTAAGVSAIDGNKQLPSGFFGEFRVALSKYYGADSLLSTGWVSDVLFEPSVGNIILKDFAAKEESLSILYSTIVEKVEKIDNRWYVHIRGNQQTQTIKAICLIDATELGDIAKACGVNYDIGMDSRNTTGESIAPDKSNSIIQDLTYVAILKNYGRDMTINRPVGYDSTAFACACANKNCINSTNKFLWSKDKMLNYGKLPNNKYMINWPIQGNDYYLNLIEKTPVQREEALKKAKDFTLCFLYFIQKELGFSTLYLADDEFPTSDLFPLIPYHRESRRIDGLVRFTVNDITMPFSQPHALYRTSIAVGDYPVDHHHNRFVGSDTLPQLHFYPIPSYGLPLGTIIPKNVNGLLVVEKSISVSNIVNGSTRLQPVVLQIGQAAGALAALSIKQKKELSEVAVRDVQSALLESGSYLLPYLDVSNESKLFKPLQRIGSTGILKGIGKNVAWSNQFWFRADTLLLKNELSGLLDYYPYIHFENTPSTLTIQEALNYIKNIAMHENIEISDITILAKSIFIEYDLADFNVLRSILRSEMAVLLDQILDPFSNKKIDLFGTIIQ